MNDGRERESNNNNNNGHGLLGTSTSKRMDAKAYGMCLMYSRKTGLHHNVEFLYDVTLCSCKCYFKLDPIVLYVIIKTK